MRNLGVIAILVGILVIVGALVGVLGQSGAIRPVMIGAIILLAVGYLLYRRSHGRPA